MLIGSKLVLISITSLYLTRDLVVDFVLRSGLAESNIPKRRNRCQGQKRAIRIKIIPPSRPATSVVLHIPVKLLTKAARFGYNLRRLPNKYASPYRADAF